MTPTDCPPALDLGSGWRYGPVAADIAEEWERVYGWSGCHMLWRVGGGPPVWLGRGFEDVRGN